MNKLCFIIWILLFPICNSAEDYLLNLMHTTRSFGVIDAMCTLFTLTIYVIIGIIFYKERNNK